MGLYMEAYIRGAYNWNVILFSRIDEPIYWDRGRGDGLSVGFYGSNATSIAL